MEILRFEQLDYVLRMPKGYEKGQKYPLVIYLHGAGGRGRDINLIYTHPFFKETQPWLEGAVSIAPQCYADTWFNIFEQLQAFIDYARGWEFVDNTRVYLVGASMGGYATWQMLDNAHPQTMGINFLTHSYLLIKPSRSHRW